MDSLGTSHYLLQWNENAQMQAIKRNTPLASTKFLMLVFPTIKPKELYMDCLAVRETHQVAMEPLKINYLFT